jgi:hypothetical protein
MTANSDNQVTITWTSPVTNGSPITSFKIYIRSIDLSFIQETGSCDGTSNTIISSRTCNVSLSLLRALPYSLVKGDSVYVKIISVNVYGDSNYSEEANGAVIQYVPDAPISLTNNILSTNAYQIMFTWSKGLSNGGTEVIDYNVYYDQGLGIYVLLAENLTTSYFTTAATLIPGVTYSFKVTARNTVGSSNYSSEISILAA